jgi:hypothetical protein
MDDNSFSEIILKLLSILYIRVAVLINEIINFKGIKTGDMVKLVVISIIIGMFFKGVMLISTHYSILKNKSI